MNKLVVLIVYLFWSTFRTDMNVYDVQNINVLYSNQEALLSWEWIVYPGDYEDCTPLSSKCIAVKDKDGKYFLLDEQGQKLSDEAYDSLTSYYEGICTARQDGKAFFINEDADLVSETVFEDAGVFSEGICPVQQDGKWGFADTSGRIIIPAQYENVKSFHEGRAAVYDKTGWGFVDKTGNSIVPCIYEQVSDYSEGRAAVYDKTGWGFVDRAGVQIAACVYQKVKDYSEGRAAVCVETYLQGKKCCKWGYLDINGAVATALQYEDANSYSEGKAAVKLTDADSGFPMWAYIDSQGSTVIDFDMYYGTDGRLDYVGAFHDGRAFVSKELYCIIDEKGNNLWQDSACFLFAFDYNETFDAVPVYLYANQEMTEKKYGMVSLDGRMRLEPVFDDVSGVYFDRFVQVSVNSENGTLKNGLIRLSEQ